MYKRWIWRLLTGLLFALTAASPALAHITLVNSQPGDGAMVRNPAAPVRLQFSGRVELAMTRVRLVAPDGRSGPWLAVLREPGSSTSALAQLPENLTAGSQVLVWRTMGADGHPATGHILLHLGAPTPGMDAARALALAAPLERMRELPGGAAAGLRWLQLLGLMMVTVWPVLTRLGLQPPRRTLAMGLLLAALGLAAGLPAALVEAGATEAVGTYLLFTLQGTWWLTRVLLLGLMALAIHRRWSGGTQALLGALLLLTVAAAGHAGGVSEGMLAALGVQWLHLAATALWAGGLMHLALGIVPDLRALPPAEYQAAWRTLTVRFGRVAAPAALVLTATGLYLARLHVGEPAPAVLNLTIYGRTLLLKLVLVGLLVLLGTGVVVMGRRLRQTGTGPTPGRLILAEAVMAAAVLLSAGLLAEKTPGWVEYLQLVAPPSMAATDGPLSVREQLLGHQVLLTVHPLVIGQDNTFDVTVEGLTPEKVEAELVMVDMGHGTTLALQPTGDKSRWQATVPLPDMAGRWAVRVKVSAGGQSESTYFYFKVAEPNPA